jgi:hypothetical protein
MSVTNVVLTVLVLLSFAARNSAAPVEVDCSRFANVNVTVPIIEFVVPAGTSYVGRCRHDAIDPALRISTSVAVTIIFRCGQNSTLTLESWQQRNGSLKIMPVAGEANLEGVRIVTTGSTKVESDSHALTLVAGSISRCSLELDDGSVRRGGDTAASFLLPAAGIRSVSDSAILVGERCEVTAIGGYAAAAIISDTTGAGALDLFNVSFGARSGSVVRASASASSGRRDFVVVLGAAARVVFLTQCTINAFGIIAEATGKYGVASVGFVSYGGSIGAKVIVALAQISASASSVTAQGDSAVASVGVAAVCSGSSLGNVSASGARLAAVSSNISAIGTSAVASVAFSIRSSSLAVITANDVSCRAEASNVTASAVDYAAAAVGVVCHSGSTSGGGTVNVLRSEFVAHSSIVTADGECYASASVGIACYSGSGNGVLLADGATLTAVQSNISAHGISAHRVRGYRELRQWTWCGDLQHDRPRCIIHFAWFRITQHGCNCRRRQHRDGDKRSYPCAHAREPRSQRLFFRHLCPWALHCCRRGRCFHDVAQSRFHQRQRE